jgi:hypothetical protein
VNYCVAEEKPIEKRICLTEGESTNEKLVLNSARENILPSETRESVVAPHVNFKEAGKFLIILLLMNCIVTTLNIIVKVVEMQNHRHRRHRQMPKLPPQEKKK